MHDMRCVWKETGLW